MYATQNPRTDSLYLFLEASTETRTFKLFPGKPSEALDAFFDQSHRINKKKKKQSKKEESADEEEEETYVPESIQLLGNDFSRKSSFDWNVDEKTKLITITVPKAYSSSSQREGEDDDAEEEENRDARRSLPFAPFTVLKLQPVPKKELSTVSVSRV